MGIDIYAEPGCSEHQSKHKPAFEAAVRERDKLPRSEQYESPEQERVEQVYRAMYGDNPYYLRESYHGSPYATRAFLREAFDAEDQTARIPAETLAVRLPRAIMDALTRSAEVYGDADAREALCELGVEPSIGDGSDPANIEADDLPNTLATIFGTEIPKVTNGEGASSDADVPPALYNAETVRKLAAEHYPVRQFVAFVKAAWQWEQEHGEPLEIHASY